MLNELEVADFIQMDYQNKERRMGYHAFVSGDASAQETVPHARAAILRALRIIYEVPTSDAEFAELMAREMCSRPGFPTDEVVERALVLARPKLEQLESRLVINVEK
ncbi:hypothetical protein HYX08_04195 [Candidatus Woesearchaeota archaeon]|nr:hypothetical protein [Candidatus Woesearchaeota archaeon]